MPTQPPRGIGPNVVYAGKQAHLIGAVYPTATVTTPLLLGPRVHTSVPVQVPLASPARPQIGPLHPIVHQAPPADLRRYNGPLPNPADKPTNPFFMAAFTAGTAAATGVLSAVPSVYNSLELGPYRPLVALMGSALTLSGAAVAVSSTQASYRARTSPWAVPEIEGHTAATAASSHGHHHH